jgi:hypothetical protein
LRNPTKFATRGLSCSMVDDGRFRIASRACRHHPDIVEGL